MSVLPRRTIAVVTTFPSLQPYSPNTATTHLCAKSTLPRFARAAAVSRLPNCASAEPRLVAM